MTQAWKKITLHNEISVEFPTLPTRKVTGDKELYLYKSENYAIMIGVANNSYRDYQSQIKETLATQEISNKFLDDVVSDKLSASNGFNVSLKALEWDKHQGREIEYSVKINKDAKSQKRYTVLLLIKERLYTFEFWCLKDNGEKEDKDRFFNSIMINQ